MQQKDILKKVKHIEIVTRRLVNDLLAGEYHSIFKGRGMEFAEVREYIHGDDIRTIDWNVSARFGSPFVKIFDEERELTVFLIVDLSASQRFGSSHQMKMELAAEVSAILAFSAIQNKDHVGLLSFSDRIEQFIPPKKGKKHVLRVIRELLFFKPKGQGTDMNAALDYFSGLAKRRAIVFLISDFVCPDFESKLRLLTKKHDVIPIVLSNIREQFLPDMGLVLFEDPETGDSVLVDTSQNSFRVAYEAAALEEKVKLESMFRRFDLDWIELRTDESYVVPLASFFSKRMRAISRS